MNTILKNTTFLICLSLFAFTRGAKAQTTTVTGPSDAVSNPPASASAVSQVLSSGSNILLKAGTVNSSASGIIYQWYKFDNTGVKQLIQSSSDSTFRETATSAGYYTYQLLISNANQCTSQISDPFQIYVLPALNPAIAASNSTVCSNGTSSAVLTATAGDTKYVYQYQWALNGTSISGATSATYTAIPANTSGSNTYSVRVNYALSPVITGTASQMVNVVPVPSKPAITIGQ